MKNKWRMPHPATMFFILMLVVAFLSWIFAIYDLNVVNPADGKIIRVNSLLSPEGIRWFLRNVVRNFTGFSPLGMVIVTMFGLGVAEHSGFINACIRQATKGRINPTFVMLFVIFLGIISNVLGDAGYIILIPIAAFLFQAAGLHPVGGIITAYVSVACGFSANLFISTLDPLLTQYTQEAIYASGLSRGNAGALSNYYFMATSALLIGGIIYWVATKYLLPSLGKYESETRFSGYKQLSRKEKRALIISLSGGFLYTLLVVFATFSPWGILRGVTGGLIRSPFIAGAIFILSFGAGLMGMLYGILSGRYRSDTDIVEGLTYPMKVLAVYFVIAFFASQMFAFFEYSQLDKCLAIVGADFLTLVEAPSFVILILFILFSAVVNMIMVSSTAKWSFMAFIFVPMFAAMGINPDWTQCAYRIGDSVTNAITPFLFYTPLVMACIQPYVKNAGYDVLLRYSWRFSLFIGIGWIGLFIIWYLLKLPLGL